MTKAGDHNLPEVKTPATHLPQKKGTQNQLKAAPKSLPKDDIVLVHSRTDDGDGIRVLRKRGEEVSAAEMRPLEEGRPIHGEVVSLQKRPEHDALYDVKTIVAAPERQGPTKVSTERYRKGWDSLWGNGEKKRHSKTLN